MYKKLAIFFLAFIPTILVGQEIKFHKNIAWDVALDIAKKENKFIFVDTYTDWCSWCKVMDKKTFKDPKVIALLNEKFLPVKINAEVGEGVKVAAKFRILGYPTTLYLTPDGMLVRKETGYLDAETLVKTLEEVVETNQDLNVKGFPLNPGFPAFYVNSYDPLFKSKTSTDEINAFMDKQEDILNEAAWSVIFRFSMDDNYTAKFLAQKDKLSKIYGKEEVQEKIRKIAYQKLKKAIDKKSEDELNLALGFVKEYFEGEEKENALIDFPIEYYKGIGDWLKFAKLINPNVKTYSASKINGYSWVIYEKCSNVEVINMACDWMAIAVQKESSYPFLDTFAALYYKVENYDEAENWAVQAIKKGNSDGEDVSETEKLLEKIRQER